MRCNLALSVQIKLYFVVQDDPTLQILLQLNMFGYSWFVRCRKVVPGLLLDTSSTKIEIKTKRTLLIPNKNSKKDLVC